MKSAQVINVPNLLSCIRLCLTLPLVYAVLTVNTKLALYTLLLAAFTDWADGFIARRFHMQTQVGAWLDPFADKVILNSTFLALAYVGIIPLWIALVLFCRDVLITLGAFFYYKLSHCLDGRANVYGKISTLIQFGVLGWCVLFPDTTIDMFILALMLFATLGSGLLYINIWGRLMLKGYQQYVQPKNCD